jgi:hypothetical protein
VIERAFALFDIYKSGIRMHLKNMFESGELSRNSFFAFFTIIASDGKLKICLPIKVGELFKISS